MTPKLRKNVTISSYANTRQHTDAMLNASTEQLCDLIVQHSTEL